jgi:uncharacterized protein (TIGR03435 family)
MAACASAQNWKEFSIGKPGAGRTQFNREGLRSDGMPLINIIWRAYGLPESRIAGPDWIDSARYAITALVEKPGDFQRLMQNELEKRFHLSAHHEVRDVPAYIMRVIPGQDRKREQPCTDADKQPQKGFSGLFAGTTTATGLADELSTMLNRPVVNETGIMGRFEVCLQWSGGQAPAAMRDRLGLDLVDGKAPLEVLVVDHIEKLQVEQ